MSGLTEATHITQCPSCRQDIDATGLAVGSLLTCPHCSHEFELHRSLGAYVLEKEIGAGGMGSVYLARDTRLNRIVAVKVLKGDLVNDEKFITTFQHEAEITASLNHPNIVQVYAFNHEEGLWYLAMEHISGGTLDDRITQFGGVTELEGLEIGIAVAQGLSFAHQRGLIHRDIKPGNILFGHNGLPKVVDFGLSLALDKTDHFEGEIWGTPYYVAPEKLEREPETWKSDLYSLGTTLFHAISGRPPYEADDPTEVAMKHLSGNIVSIKAFAPTVSNQTAYAIQKAIARYPDDRYESYEAFISQLEDAKRRLLQNETPEEEPVNLTDATNSKNAIYLIIAVVVLTLLLAVGGYFLMTVDTDKLNQPTILKDYDPTAKAVGVDETPQQRAERLRREALEKAQQQNKK